jgi:hypothetical protein
MKKNGEKRVLLWGGLIFVTCLRLQVRAATKLCVWYERT